MFCCFISGFSVHDISVRQGFRVNFPLSNENRIPMKLSNRLSYMIAACSLALSGCGTASSDHSTSPGSEKAVSNGASDAASNATSTASDAPVANATTEAEAETKGVKATLSERTPSTIENTSQAKSAPTTAMQAIAMVNLVDLPRLNEKNEGQLENGVTYLNYTGKGVMADGDAFYQKLLVSRGWNEIPPLSPPSEQYVDRLFERGGYYLRVNLYPGREPGDLSVMLANLGNIDVRSLPKLQDADVAQIPSTPVNATYHSSRGIPDATEALLQTFTDSGWQRCNEYHPTSIDVPHYRDLHFRKEACRLHVGVVKNPQEPNGKTTVFYHAESVTPFDIPTTDTTAEIKFDPIARRASFGASNSRSELVALLKANSQKFGWELGPTEKFEAGKEHWVPMLVSSETYVVARLVESDGKYYGSLESCASLPKESETEAERTASLDGRTGDEDTTLAHDASFDKISAQVDATIQAEISKALGSINAPASSSTDLAALQAMAEELTKNHDSSEAAELGDDSEEGRLRPNPFDVPEDATAPAAEYRSIKKAICKLKHAGKSHTLSHAACYVVKEEDSPTKCVIFSDSPIDVELLKRELLDEGKPICRWYLSKDATNMLCFLIRDYGVSVEANIGKLSMGIANDKLKATLFHYQGKITGKLVTTDPIDVGDSSIEIAAELNQPVIQVDWAKRNAPQDTKLVVDASKEYLLPEGCSEVSSEGSRYSKKIEATIQAPIAIVQAFYAEQLEAKGWKEAGNAKNGFKKYRTSEQEMVLKLESVTETCKIEIHARNFAAAKADAMLPPAGKAMLVLGNLSDAKVQMTIAGKGYEVSPSEGQNPKDATKVIVEPGSVKIQVTVENSSKKFDMTVDPSANSTWGVLFDTSFQDVLRLF